MFYQVRKDTKMILKTLLVSVSLISIASAMPKGSEFEAGSSPQYAARSLPYGETNHEASPTSRSKPSQAYGVELVRDLTSRGFPLSEKFKVNMEKYQSVDELQKYLHLHIATDLDAALLHLYLTTTNAIEFNKIKTNVSFKTLSESCATYDQLEGYYYYFRKSMITQGFYNFKLKYFTEGTDASLPFYFKFRSLALDVWGSLQEMKSRSSPLSADDAGKLSETYTLAFLLSSMANLLPESYVAMLNTARDGCTNALNLLYGERHFCIRNKLCYTFPAFVKASKEASEQWIGSSSHTGESSYGLSRRPGASSLRNPSRAASELSIRFSEKVPHRKQDPNAVKISDGLWKYLIYTFKKRIPYSEAMSVIQQFDSTFALQSKRKAREPKKYTPLRMVLDSADLHKAQDNGKGPNSRESLMEPEELDGASNSEASTSEEAYDDESSED